MQMKTPPPLPSVVKREDKMENLRAFISAFWLTPRGDKDIQTISVIARSAESPIARALVAMSSEIAALAWASGSVLSGMAGEH